MPNRFCEHCGAPLEAAADTCPQCGVPTTVRPAVQKRRTWRDPVVLALAGCGCLALIPIAGIIAAILIPNFLDALHKGRQRRTAEDLRTMAATLIAVSMDDEAGYPEVSSLTELKARLGDAAADWPETDAWEHAYRYQCWAERAATGCDTFRLASPGRDGILESEDLREVEQASFLPTEYHRDLVIAEFGWVQVPSSIGEIEEGTASDDPGAPGPAAEGEDSGDGQD